MQKELSKKLFEAFEEAVHNNGGTDFWYARDLMGLLGYKQWKNFINAIDKAKEACKNAQNNESDHFAGVGKMVDIGSGALREIDDIMLTRYACYLVAQNGDTAKREIAYAQSYFASQTRKMELIEKRFDELGRLQDRLKLTSAEVAFSRSMFEAGIDGDGFGRIRSKGDRALFGLKTSELKKKFGVNDNRPLADFLPSIAISAKEFASQITSFNIKKNSLEGERKITDEHIKNNSTIRNALAESGIKPEELPIQEDIKKVERKVKSEGKRIVKETRALPKPNPMNF